MIQSIKSTKFEIFVCSKSDFDERMVFKKIADISLDDEHKGFYLTFRDYQAKPINSLKHEKIISSMRNIKFQKMKIIIKDTKLKRSPVIKSLEIWGNLSKDNDEEMLKKMHSLMKPESSILPQMNNEILEITNETENELKNIPEEFLDSITHELLVMPFILPSGNIVDQLTIEKHNRNEEAYGRLPSDPFTGIIYTSDHQPEFNAALKARLDEFKTKNCDLIEVKQSGRTIGKKPESFPSTSSSSYINNTSNGHIAKKIKLQGNDLDSIISEMYKNNQVSIFTKPPLKTLKTETHDVHKKCQKCGFQNSADNNFYRIDLCKHIFCKNCILGMKVICFICKFPFESKNVVKLT